MIILVSWFLVESIKKQNHKNYEHALIETYFNKDGNPKVKQDDSYYGILEIPKIDFKRGYYSNDDYRNNIDSNVTLIDVVDDKDYIFAAHSGYGSKAYFNNIQFLDRDDIINLYINNSKYVFKVDKKYLNNKQGKVNIINGNKKRVILVTCNNDDPNNYLVITASLAMKKDFI